VYIPGLSLADTEQMARVAGIFINFGLMRLATKRPMFEKAVLDLVSALHYKTRGAQQRAQDRVVATFLQWQTAGVYNRDESFDEAVPLIQLVWRNPATEEADLLDLLGMGSDAASGNAYDLARSSHGVTAAAEKLICWLMDVSEEIRYNPDKYWDAVVGLTELVISVLLLLVAGLMIVMACLSKRLLLASSPAFSFEAMLPT